MREVAARAVVLLAALSSVACRAERTEVVVVVSTDELAVPTDLDALRLTVTDRALTGATATRFDDMVPLCAAEARSGCYALPLTLTIIPGDRRPGDPVTVDVEALHGGTQLLRDEATFTFHTGDSMRLDFFLYRVCVNSDCAANGTACNAAGTCEPLMPTSSPALDMTGGADLGASATDGAPADDLSGADLGGCANVAACAGGDGCCPAGCNRNTDGDCPSVCGNNAVEPGEVCDDGNTANGDACDPSCQYTNTLSVLSGRPGAQSCADGGGAAARFDSPFSISSDGQRLFVGDINGAVLRQIDPATGAVTTLAGRSYAAAMQDGTGSAARLKQPFDVQYLAAAVYINDYAVLRKLDLASQQLSTIGSVTPGLNRGIGSDGNKLFVITADNTLVAWDPANPTAPAVNVSAAGDANGCSDVACDSASCYLACNTTLKRVASSGGTATVYGGTGTTGCSDNQMLTSATFRGAVGIVWAANHLYVPEADFNCQNLRDVTATGVSTIAGGSNNGYLDGPALSAQFFYLRNAATIGDPASSGSPGTLFLPDVENEVVRKLSGAPGARVVTTLAGARKDDRLSYAPNGADARYRQPFGLTSDGSSLFVADYTAGAVVNVAPGSGGSANVVTTQPTFYPSLVHRLGATLFLAGNDGKLYSVPASGGMPSLYLGMDASGMTDDGASLFVVDKAQHVVQRVKLADKSLTLVAGAAGATDVHDDAGAMAHFKSPRGLVFDGGNLYTLDSGGTLVRRIEVGGGNVTTLAGADGLSGAVDDVGAAARFAGAFDLTSDGGRLFITDPGCGYTGCAGGGADLNGPTIRELDLATNRVTTMVGMRGTWSTVPGVGRAAAVNKPTAILFDAGTHALYITDGAEGVIDRIR
jgi:cysteine-rich repeat protein